jgi:hypothetical protein
MIQLILAPLPFTAIGFWFWMFWDMTKNDNLPPRCLMIEGTRQNSQSMTGQPFCLF